LATNDAKTLQRGLEILEKLAQSPSAITVAELAKSIGIHRTSAYRYLRTLLKAGYVRGNSRNSYELSTKILELGSHLLYRLPLHHVAHPFLVKLSAETSKTIHLCILDNCDVIYIDKVESHRSLPLSSRIGSRAPAYCTAVGKVLLASLPSDHLLVLLKETNLEKRTSMTICDPLLLLQEIKVTNERGYAIDNGEHEEGIQCFAAPIRGYSGDCLAALSITGLRRDFDDSEETAELIAALKKTAAEISHALGSVDCQEYTGRHQLSSAERR
jgi:DNA-binding IclR family transcriptional regulator